MKILITGGLGFIGGRLGIHLSTIGHEIVLGTSKHINLPFWLDNGRLAKIDWQSEESLSSACRGVDLIIHAAGMNARECEIDPVAAHEFNGNATSRLLNTAINSYVKTFIYISSSHVYSNPLQGVIDENTPPANPHPYATSHLKGENYVTGAREKGLINSMVLRVANAYGAPAWPGVNCWMLLVNNLCMQAVTSRELKLRTSGFGQRNFITLSDVCVIINKLIDFSVYQNLPQILNIGNTHSNTVQEMAELIQSRCEGILGFSPKIIWNRADSTQIFKSLEFKSLYSNQFRSFIVNERDSEIDKLLNFCKIFFASNKL